MDRPTSGHRYQAGSITVVDLIRRQQGPVRIPSAHEMATVGLVDDLLGARVDARFDAGFDAAEPADGQHGWVAKGAKLAGLALGSLMLCGSVYAASTLTHHRSRVAAADLTAGPVVSVLTGVGALRPDTLAAQLSPTPSPPVPTSSSPTPTPALPGLGSIASGRATGTVVGHATDAPAPTDTRHDGADGYTGPVSAAGVVRSFYQLVAIDPDLATRLVSPSLLGTGRGLGFDNAWQSVTVVDVESVDQTSAHSVLAVVRLLGKDGTWLRVVELLHLTGGAHPLINGAELLSAQHG